MYGHQGGDRGCGHWGITGGVGVSEPVGVSGHLGAGRAVGSIRRPAGGIGGVRGIGGGRWTGSPTTLGPSLGSQSSHWFPWGVTYLTKARQVTERSSAGYYIHLTLHFVTVCTFVSTLPNHIFLHAM